MSDWDWWGSWGGFWNKRGRQGEGRGKRAAVKTDPSFLGEVVGGTGHCAGDVAKGKPRGEESGESGLGTGLRCPRDAPPKGGG